MSSHPFVVALGYVVCGIVAIAMTGIFFAYLSHIHTEDHRADLLREQGKGVQVELCGHIELEANRVLCLQAVNGR